MQTPKSERLAISLNYLKQHLINIIVKEDDPPLTVNINIYIISTLASHKCNEA